jgi:replicative DNA helicase
MVVIRCRPTARPQGLLPHNIEAEQQLLGAILSSNDVLDRVEDLVKPDHFFDPCIARSSR